MSGLEPLVLAQIGLGVASQFQQFQQNSAQAKVAEEAARQQAEQVKLAASIESRRRKDLLDRASASARARFGARGVGDDGGSAGAVLTGLLIDGEQEAAEQGALMNSRLAAIDRGLGANLLELAQARDRHTIGVLRNWVGIAETLPGRFK
jgi:hypothetical protein